MLCLPIGEPQQYIYCWRAAPSGTTMYSYLVLHMRTAPAPWGCSSLNHNHSGQSELQIAVLGIGLLLAPPGTKCLLCDHMLHSKQ